MEKPVSPAGQYREFRLTVAPGLRAQGWGPSFVNFIITRLLLRLEGKVSSLQAFMSCLHV